MKLQVSWKNNEPTAAQRVYATDPATKLKKRIAEVGAGLETIEIDLATLPNGPVVWPSIITVVAVKGDTESAEKSAKVLFVDEGNVPGKFAAVMDVAVKGRPAELPVLAVKGSTVPDAKFNSTYAHFVVDGVLYQNIGAASSLFDLATVASVPTTPELNIDLTGKEGTPVRGINGEFYVLGDGYADSEKAWEWKDGALTLVAELTEGKSAATYRHTVVGQNGKIYRFGGSGSVDSGKLLISVFDPVAKSWEVIRQDAVNYMGMGNDVFGAIDYNGMLLIIDTTYKRYVTINTKTGALHADAFDEFAPLTGLTARTIVGGNGVVYAVTGAKQLTAITLAADGTIEKIEAAHTYADAGYATCLALAVTGELVVGTQDEGKLVLIDPVAKTSRLFQIPGGKWINSIYRHGTGLTVVDVEKAHHVDFENYQLTFDAAYDQSQLGATNFYRQI